MVMKIIAHRGGAGYRLENTLSAFKNALALGCYGAELDVHLTKDRKVVVHHNPALNWEYCSRSDGLWLGKQENLPINSFEYSELKEFRIGQPNPGSDFAARHPRMLCPQEERIPLLDEVVQLVKAHSDTFTLIIEIKSPVLQAAPQPWVQLVEASLAVLEREKFTSRSMLCSFDWGALIYAKKFLPQLSTWFLTHPLSWLDEGEPPDIDRPPRQVYLEQLRSAWLAGSAPWYSGFDPRDFGQSYAAAISAAGGDAWFMYHSDVRPEAVSSCHEAGLLCSAWSVEVAEPFFDGVVEPDFFCTDYPHSSIELKHD
jgi:glycerophosphoryl diester phosphodiesterase